MAADLGGSWIEIKPHNKVLYHAAAVFACNYLVTLTKTATDLWQGFGIPPEKAIKALLPLMKGTINNIENIGIPQCLTGTGAEDHPHRPGDGQDRPQASQPP
jgi:predicted short-subunit dehydrogenase-like oxidoreductase (DUF2520 family)